MQIDALYFVSPHSIPYDVMLQQMTNDDKYAVCSMQSVSQFILTIDEAIYIYT